VALSGNVETAEPFAGDGRQTPARLIFAFVLACAIERAIAMLVTGFKGDEAYTLVVSRTLALSYFDHPPLHQWLLHGFVALFGEGRWTRAPFWAAIVLANIPMFGLSRRLFGREAACWTLFAFNAATYVLVLPNGFIVPDMTLQLSLLSAGWAMAEILFAPDGGAVRTTALWLAVGIALGGAGLSKYSAIFAPLGFFGFFLGAPKHRRWLGDIRPYLAALVALAIISPALIWNYQKDWLSLSFQASRATPQQLSFDIQSLWQWLGIVGTQIGLLSPWVFAPLALGLIRAARNRDADGPQRFLLWLAAPPLALLVLMPLFGQYVLPHWFNSAWLFAFPLAGQWLAGKSRNWLKTWGLWTAASAAATAIVYILAMNLGMSWIMSRLPPDANDPTNLSYDWPDVSRTPAWAALGVPAPAFVVADNWRYGGKIGAALGPEFPVCTLGDDPREFAFTCDTLTWIGKDAAIVVVKEDAERGLKALAPYFARIDAPQEFAVGRGGRAEQVFVLARGRALTHPYFFPYGPRREK